jgi:hypothetical protein
MIGPILVWAWIVAVLGAFVWQFRDIALLILARLGG